jgi:ribosome assembly protein RRB1
MGDLISGSTDGRIYLHHLSTDWSRENKPYEYHKGSVEDVQFSPLESFAFASCSTDGNLCIVDTREGKFK